MTHFFTRPDWYCSTAAQLRIAVTTMPIFGAPKALYGMRALFVSDVHMRPEMDSDAFAALLAQQSADLILFGGDLSDTREQTLRLLRSMRHLRAPLGIYACCGNNDSEAFPNRAELAAEFEKIGAKLLMNDSVCIPIDHQKLYIGGIDEPRHGQPEYSSIFPDSDGYCILLSHYPILPHAEPSKMPNLMLSGHTHGGQFNFLGITPYSIGFEQSIQGRPFPPALVSGERTFGSTHVVVSKGVGMSRIPLRIGVRSEINLLPFEC